MGDGYYRLTDDKRVLPSAGYDRVNHRVGYDEVNGYRVSTVFLSVDHRHGDGPPLVFETMVFPGDSWGEIYGQRYSTWDEAVAGHAAAIDYAKSLPEAA